MQPRKPRPRSLISARLRGPSNVAIRDPVPLRPLHPFTPSTIRLARLALGANATLHQLLLDTAAVTIRLVGPKRHKVPRTSFFPAMIPCPLSPPPPPPPLLRQS